MIVIKLAWRNIIGGGFRSWLNVFILSVVLVTIIGFHGLYIGWQHDAENAMINWHIAGGQYWHRQYDPYDPFTFDKSRGKLPLLPEVKSAGFLVSQGVIYPQGRLKNITIKGIQTDQKLLEFPSHLLEFEPDKFKMMTGHRTANKLNLTSGDKITLRWRDAYGSFDAAEFQIVHIFKTTIASIDQQTVWLGLQQMQNLLNIPHQITYFSVDEFAGNLDDEWLFKSTDDLLAEFRAIYATEIAGGVFMYILLIFLAMIAVFDTQVLALFKRRREIGMMIALGMKRSQIIKIFTAEGLISGFLATALAAIWGTPLLISFQNTGLKLPEMMDDYGMDGLLDAMYPQYTIGLVVLTVSVIMLILLVVSYLPVRSISRLNPVDPLRGKMTR